MAARRTASAILAERVAGRFALAIHHRMIFRDDGGNSANHSLARSFVASSAARSFGTTSESTPSYDDQEPSFFAASIFARPAGVIRCSLIRRRARFLLIVDQGLFGFRCEKSCL